MVYFVDGLYSYTCAYAWKYVDREANSAQKFRLIWGL